MEIVVDANIFLNVKNREEPFYSYSEQILNSIDDGRNRAILSTVVIAEICCGYYLTGETKDKDDFILHVSSSQNYHVIDVNTLIADQAAYIRSKTGMKMPDAIIVATGIVEKAKSIITNDKDSFKKAAKLIKIQTSKEFFASAKSLGHS
jgi:predicted nucleic acid-binding protein